MATSSKLAALVQRAIGEACCTRPLATTSSSLSPVRALTRGEAVVQENAPGRVNFMRDLKRELVSWPEALKCLRSYSLRSIPETVQLAILANMDLKGGRTKDPFRGTMQFPHNFGDVRQVLLLAEDEVLEKNVSADLKGGEEIIAKLERNLYNKKFDVVVATPIMYSKMRQLQSILRVKMPNPRTGTVVEGDQVNEAIAQVKQVKAFRSNKTGTINCSVGKLDFDDSMLEENMRYLLGVVVEHRGSLTNINFLKRLTLSTSYGPGFDIFANDLL